MVKHLGLLGLSWQAVCGLLCYGQIVIVMFIVIILEHYRSLLRGESGGNSEIGILNNKSQANKPAIFKQTILSIVSCDIFVVCHVKRGVWCMHSMMCHVMCVVSCLPCDCVGDVCCVSCHVCHMIFFICHVSCDVCHV